jgi:hypothetical protein
MVMHFGDICFQNYSFDGSYFYTEFPERLILFCLFRLLNTCFNKCIDKRYFLFFVFLLVVRDPYESAESI